ncbi:MAG: hypothetical protein ACOCY1_02830, partial [Halovenus sp.]
MSDKRIYTLTIPGGSRIESSSTVGQRQSLQALLDSDLGDVQTTGTNPTERPVTIEIPDDYAALRAQELAELAAGIDDPVVYTDLDGVNGDDGFVTVSEASPSPIDPRSDNFQRVNLNFEAVGTRRTHYRSVKTTIGDLDTGGGWGNTQEAHIAVPSDAEKVRWVDLETRERDEPSVVETRDCEFSEVDILDASNAPQSDPTLIYDLPYSEEGYADVRVWDTRGHGTAVDDRTDSDGALQQEKVFVSSHDYDGYPVVESGRLRLVPDESDNDLQAERWDGDDESYETVDLGDSDWEL